MKTSLFALFTLFSMACIAFGADAPGMLHVLAYDRTIPREVCLEFTEKTGIPVDISTAISSMEAADLLYKKNTSYDLLLLSNDVVVGMKNKGKLQALDHKKIPTSTKLKSHWREAAGDVLGQFRLPFDIASMGLLVDRRVSQPEISGCMDAFRKPRLGGVAVMVDQRDFLAAALLSLGASVNDLSAENLRAAAVILKNWLRNTAPSSTGIWSGSQAFAFDSIRNELVKGRHGAALLYSGDAITLINQFPSRFEWINPVEGSLKYMSVFAIPKDSKRPDAAHAFIEFLLDPKTAVKIVADPSFGIPLTAPWSKMPLNFFGNPASMNVSDLMDCFSVQADITREPQQDLEALFKSLPPPTAPPAP